MARSIVLKDLSNRPEGYVRLSEGDLLCRTALKEDAQLVVLFEDGTKKQLSLDGSMQEQRFRGEGKQILGCCVCCGEDLILVSDEHMRIEFCRYAVNRSKVKESMKEKEPAAAQEELCSKKTAHNAGHVFVQSRWPPPPCWDTASYHHGCWIEKEMRRV